ncbi:MAG: hypothetical protein KA914_04030 [Ottowia sp.]|nr:hypothetical protein [Ottowia sp.]
MSSITSIRDKSRWPQWLAGGLLALSLVGPSWAATTATARGYGLNATASVAGIGLGLPLADTGIQTAPPNFNALQSLATASVSAGALLSVNAGVLTGTAQSALAQNTVAATGGVANLNLTLLGVGGVGVLGVASDAVSSSTSVTCAAGVPVATQSSSIANLRVNGLLGSIVVPVNPGPNTVIGVPGVASITLNEQIALGGSFATNAIHININVAGLITADIAIGHSQAAMPNCAAAPGSVSINVPNITPANQSSVPVAGNCTVGGGGVVISAVPAINPATVTAVCQSNGTYAALANASAVPDGSVTFTATQDSVTASTTVTKTTPTGTPPTVTIAAAANITSANQAAYTLSGTCSVNGQAVVVTAGGAAVASVTCAAGAWSATGLNVSALPEGVVVFVATHTDGSGNSASASTQTLKDTVAPVVVISTYPPANAANVSSYSTSGTCTAGDGAVTVSFNGGLTQVVACNSGLWTVPSVDLSSLPEGTFTISAQQTDAAGNTGVTTRAVLKDTVAPTVTVTAPAEINAGNQASYSVSGTCTVGDGPVTVVIGGLLSVVPCSGAGTWTVSGVNVAALPAGPVNITATQTDAAGNAGTGTGTANKTTPSSGDTTPPVVTVTAPPIDAGNQGSYQPSGTCTAGDGAVSVVIGTIPVTAVCTPGGTWVAPPTDVSSLPQGQVTVSASQTDAAGNTGSATAVTTKATPPSGGVVGVPAGGALAGWLLLLTGVVALGRRQRRGQVRQGGLK